MAGSAILPMNHATETKSAGSNSYTASSISGPSGGYGTTHNSQHSGDETTVSGVTLPTVLVEEPPKPPPPERNESFSRRSPSRRESHRSQTRRVSHISAVEEPSSREFSGRGSSSRRESLHRSGSFSRESVQRSGSFSKRSQSRRGSHRSQSRRGSHRSNSNRSNRSKRRIDGEYSSSSSDSSTSSWTAGESRRSLGQATASSSSASTIFESLGDSEESSDMEEASSISYEEDEDDEMDDDGDTDEDSDDDGSFPVISFPDSNSVVSGLTTLDVDFDVSRLTLLRDELNELKQKAVAEGDELSKEELIRCLERLQNIQKDVLQDVDIEEKSVAGDIKESFRVGKTKGEEASKTSDFSSEWESDTEKELDVAKTAMAERKELSEAQLTTTSSPKIVEENKKSRKIKKQVSQEVSEAATPRANNKASKPEIPPKKKKKKLKKKIKKRRPENPDADANTADADDDATPKVKTKKKRATGTKPKKKRKSKEKKRGSKSKRKSDGDKIVDDITTDEEDLDMDQKYVALNDQHDVDDTDKTPKRRTKKGLVSMDGEGKSKSPSYIKTHSERFFRHPLFQSNTVVPTSPGVTEPVDGDLNGSPSAFPRRSLEQRENSRRSGRSLPVVPDTDPNAAKRRTLPRFMSSRNVTPSPGKSPGKLQKKMFSNPSLGIYVSAPTPPATPPTVKTKSMSQAPLTAPAAGKRRSMSRFMHAVGRDSDKPESQTSRNSNKSPKRNSKQRKEEVDTGDETDHAVMDTDRSTRRHRGSSLGRLFNGRGRAESPTRTHANKKALRDSKQEKEELNHTDHAVADTERSTRNKRSGSLGSIFNSSRTTDSPSSIYSSKRSIRGRKSKQEKELNETDHAVADTDRSTRKQRSGSLGRLFIGRGSGHSLSSSMHMPPAARDVRDVSSPSDTPRNFSEAPATDRSTRSQHSIGRLFNNGRSHSPSSFKVRKPQSSSTLDDVDEISSPSAADVQKQSVGHGIPQTDPNAGARRSLGRLFKAGGEAPSSPQSMYNRRSMRSMRTMRTSGHSTNPQRSTSVRTERTTSIRGDEPSPTGLQLRKRHARNSGGSMRSRRTLGGEVPTTDARNSGGSMRSRRTLGGEVPTTDSAPATRQAFPSYSNIRGRSVSPSSMRSSKQYEQPEGSPGPRLVKGRKASRPSFVPKTAPVGPKSRVSMTSHTQSSQYSGGSFPMVPDLSGSGDEMEDREVLDSSSRRSSRHSSRYVYMDSSGHLNSMDPHSTADDQLDLDRTTAHSNDEKGGRKARRGGRKNTLSPSPRQRLKKNKGADEDAAKSLARAKERREQLLSKEKDESSESANGVGRAPRKKKSLVKTNKSSRNKKADMYRDEKEGGTEPTEQDAPKASARSSGSSRGIRSISNLVTRMRRNKAQETIDC
ncbi:unnamed protein product [Cylindrotheca closterium]|uniref:Uncharacterized protein n=1 Tax=Cylindrotheca closterium TaxID=2856 RepID=A0AAD2G8P2_9STRA|nr:unnamed protein product [Cylindrotheca closterium]